MTELVLILWDIDKTLVDSDGLGRQLCDDAFERLSGMKRALPFTPDGSTDPTIVTDLFRLHELSIDDLSPARVARAYEEAFQALIDQWRQRAQPMPGAAQALSALAEQPGVVQSVLTGNVAGNALAKLEAIGLADNLDFEIGAYGSDEHEIRADLVTLAQQRAQAKHGVVFGPANTVLIGDTPRDIAAAHGGGARVIGVATGVFSADELREAEPDAVVEDLTGIVPIVFDALSGAS